MKFLDVPQTGSIAGNTHSHNRAGQYKRNRRSPVQPVGTGRRAFIRGAFGGASQLWGTLTDPERASWASAADSHPVVDRLGQSIKLTGHQLFVAVNTQLTNVGAAQSSTVPPDFSVYTLTDVAVTAAAGTPALSVAFDGGAAPDLVNIAFAPPQPPGRSFVSRFWQAHSDDADSGPYNGLTAFVGEFGALVAGQKIFAKVTPVNQYGVTGVPVIVSCIVAA